MTPAGEARAGETLLPASCAACGNALEVCAFCDKEDCPHALCYRCVRIAVHQELAQPHIHGG